MIFSNNKKFIFFHVPKVAGSSINKALRKYSTIPSERLYNYIMEYSGGVDWLGAYQRHIKPRDLKPKIKPEKFKNYFKFAFVRNPWDWHVSQFHYHKNDANAYFHQQLKDKTFEEYVHWSTNNVEEANSVQYDFLSDHNGELLVDQVGKFEQLYDDFNAICEKLGVNNELPKVNTSKRKKDYTQYYTTELQEIIAETNKKDIDTFGYEFKG